MPQKSLNQRLRKAKREGVPTALKASDVGRVPPRASKHALKKSGHVVGDARFEDRRVSPKRAPSAQGLKTAPDLRTTYASERRSRVGLLRVDSESVGTKRHPVATVRGRKKEPSRMHLKSRGG